MYVSHEKSVYGKSELLIYSAYFFLKIGRVCKGEYEYAFAPFVIIFV